MDVSSDPEVIAVVMNKLKAQPAYLHAVMSPARHVQVRRHVYKAPGTCILLDVASRSECLLLFASASVSTCSFTHDFAMIWLSDLEHCEDLSIITSTETSA